MLIQCKEDLFQEICKIMTPYEPEIIEENGTGYIDCFDKDWIFIYLSEMQHPTRYAKIVEHIKRTLLSYLIGLPREVKLIQQKLSETEQYIFCRCIEEKYEILWGATSYIKFKGGERQK